MDFENMNKIKDKVVLIDPYIHKKSKLSKNLFLDRIRNIEFLRTIKNTNYLSFYITSIDENNNLIKFHNLINKGIFDFKYDYVFAIEINHKLYNWFKATDIVIIQKQIVCWMASLYYFNLNKREILEKQAYKPLFEEMLIIIEKYYKDFPVPDFDYLTEQFYDYDCDDNNHFDKELDFCNKYKQVCQEFYNSEPPEFLSSPFDYKYLEEWGVNEYYNFDILVAYLNDADWERIVIKGNSNDNMHRVESNDGLFMKWKHAYTAYDQTNNFVYSFYLKADIYFNKQHKNKREQIPQSVKNEVWLRDKGLCVICGSNEKLEFDHIIPVVKGGSSTYRNIQLLCEKCNRKKHDNL